MRTLSKTTSVLLFIVVVWASHACVHEPFGTATPDPQNPGDTTGDPCDPDSVYFERDLLPLFQGNCAMSGCHNAASAQEGVILDSYTNIVNTGDVRPGRPDNSEIYEKITEGNAEDRMPPPPAAPLTSAQIEMIRKWINQGAKDLTCEDNSVCDVTNITYTGTIVPIFQNKGCIGCHSSGNPVILNNHSGAQAVALDGRLYGAVNHEAGYQAMPQGGQKLDSCTIAKIKLWVDAGAPNN